MLSPRQTTTCRRRRSSRAHPTTWAIRRLGLHLVGQVEIEENVVAAAEEHICQANATQVESDCVTTTAASAVRCALFTTLHAWSAVERVNDDHRPAARRRDLSYSRPVAFRCTMRALPRRRRRSLRYRPTYKVQTEPGGIRQVVGWRETLPRTTSSCLPRRNIFEHRRPMRSAPGRRAKIFVKEVTTHRASCGRLTTATEA